MSESRREWTDDLVQLRGSSWALWRCVGLRRAGFPANQVLRLAAPQLAESCDNLLKLEKEANDARLRSLQELQAMSRNDTQSSKTIRCTIRRTRNKLKKGKPPGPPSQVRLASIEAFCETLRRVELASKCFKDSYELFSVKISAELRRVAGSPAFREAVTWQNRAAVHTALESLFTSPLNGYSKTARHRRKEQMVASYLQRYAVKNDTIGFFGPVGWARFVCDRKSVASVVNNNLLGTRTVYFESWAIEALAKVLARRLDLYRWICPIRMPFVTVEDLAVFHPIYGCVHVTPTQVAILHAATGQTTARDIAAKLGWIDREDHFYQYTRQLAAKGLIYWEFNIPSGPHPECSLRRALERIDDQRIRDQAIAFLDEMISARNLVQRAAGNVQELDRALQNVEQCFERQTGLPATRDCGKSYAGRTIVYEDCRSNDQVEIGTDVLHHLSGPLSLLLASARWFTFEFGSAYMCELGRIFATLAAQAKSEVVSAMHFWLKAAPILFDSQSDVLSAIEQNFQKKWEAVLGEIPDVHALEYTVEDLKPRVSAEFAALRAGWADARYHSPDVMIAASDEQAIARGDYKLILGELHIGTNPLSAGVFICQHPQPGDLLRAIDRDLGVPSIVPVLAKGETGVLWRTMPVRGSSETPRLEYSGDHFTEYRDKAVPIGSLVIRKVAGELLVMTRDERIAFKVSDLLMIPFSIMVQHSFRILRSLSHVPRISFDRVVITRETWRLSPSDMCFAHDKDPANRFLRTRAWARKHGMPRFVFVRAPNESKPFFLDFDSPIYVALFLAVACRTMSNSPPGDSILEVVEMLPDLDQLWLRDADGNRYTNELRMVGLDTAMI